jgi:Transcriptional regulator
MSAKNVRELVVKAVGRVIASGGLANMTIDAVSKEAGISKGGVLHYFFTKQDLLLSVLDDFVRWFYKRRDAIAATLPDKKNRMLKATVMAMVENLNRTLEKGLNLATVLDDPALSKGVAEFKKTVLKEVGRGYPTEKVALVMYIVDGLWLDDRFTPSVVSKKTRNAVIKDLLAIIDAM